MKSNKKRNLTIVLTGLLCIVLVSCARERGRTDIALEMTDEDSVEAIIDQDLLTAGGTVVNLEEPEQTTSASQVVYVDETESQKPALVESDQSLKPTEEADSEKDSYEEPAIGLIDVEDTQIASEVKEKDKESSTKDSVERALTTEELIDENKALINSAVDETMTDEITFPDEIESDVTETPKTGKTEKIDEPGVRPAVVRPPGGSYYTEYTTLEKTPSSSRQGVKREKALDKKPPSYKNHTVKRGDTLWVISRKYGCTISDLVAENNISRRSILKIGQVLKIPEDKNEKESIPQDAATTVGNVDGSPSIPAKVISETVEVEVEAPRSETATYTVQSGDSYWKIARKYGVTSSELMSLNNTDNSIIRVGQKILVPGK